MSAERARRDPGTAAPAEPDQASRAAAVRATVEHLASIERPSASDGEREAAEWIATELERRGCPARVEGERAHGTLWWPLGLLCGLGAAGGVATLLGRRRAGAAAGTLAAAGIWDDVGGRGLRFRRLLPHRTTWNVVAEAGDPAAVRTLVVVAHHDAAHAGWIYDPRLLEAIGARFPALVEGDDSPPLLRLVFAGPALVALGALARRPVPTALGAAISLGAAATFVDIGRRDVVPGANDNLTGVATLLELANALRERPLDGLRVLLVSTGSEESFMEGMHGFMRRHGESLPPERTHVLCVDTVGSPRLVAPEGEGMIVRRFYDPGLKDLLSEAAAESGIELLRDRFNSFATDALVALRRGYRAALIGSIGRYTAPTNYHWPTDIPENVDYERVADTVALCEGVARRLAERPADLA